MKQVKRLLLATVVAGLATASSAATVKSVSVEPAGAEVRVTVAFDDRFDAPSAFALDAPQRLVIDLPGNKADTRSYPGQGAVTGARTAQFAADKARLVIDLSGPMTLGQTSAADNKLILTLKPAETAAFAKMTKGRTKLPGIAAPVEVAKFELPDLTPPAKAEPKNVEAKVTLTPAPAKPAVTKAERAAAKATPAVERAIEPFVDRITVPPRQALTKTSATTLSPKAAKATPVRAAAVKPGFRPLVVIDAGHGGHDPGSISVYGGRQEKDATLAISKAIAAEINRQGKARAILTRTGDTYLVHRERFEIARRQKAALFISVHADAAPVPEARGATVYTLSEVASDREAARLAAKENKTSVLAGFDFARESRDVADILIDLSQRETMNASAAFATVLQREMSPKVHFKSNAHRFAGFLVLKAPDVPSVLLETGYVSNEQDARFVFSEAGQKAIAEGVASAVDVYLNRRVAQR
ncbi:N-acetylmuramoyl-L-alanine amidase [Sphingoaurantiacus capsulatus]|uniref:N-acetylmuramoyl-L-alanine amidase n=1 Tax=Sphingoaurantiacus capsulatus TaxID=1771310 RepID=A0ABV7XBT9_9SPHN